MNTDSLITELVNLGGIAVFAIIAFQFFIKRDDKMTQFMMDLYSRQEIASREFLKALDKSNDIQTKLVSTQEEQTKMLIELGNQIERLQDKLGTH